MIIAGLYSFNSGKEYIDEHNTHLLKEIETVIGAVDASAAKTKTSKEITMPGRMLYSPRALNAAFKTGFAILGWEKRKVASLYSSASYTPGYTTRATTIGAFREIDFVKEKLGIEVQFGKYAFMVYNVCAKMTIFNKLGFIDAGVEIVPVKQFADEMSTGVSYFEQFVWDLEHRGVSNIDIPVLVVGVDADIAPSI